MEDLVNWAIVVGSIGGLLIVIGKFVHKALSADILNKIEKMHVEYMNETKILKREVVVLAKEQSEIKIEQRGNRQRSHALSGIMQEALLSRELSKRLHTQFDEIDQFVDQQLEESDESYQAKIDVIENEINANGKK